MIEAARGSVTWLNISAHCCNVYHQQAPKPIVVCGRSADYLALQARLTLPRAVSIQPLTNQQIERYLHSTKGQLRILQQALNDDPELYELVRRPLMLDIFTIAYQGATSQDLSAGRTREAKLQQVFVAYVERMFSRRSILKNATRERMLRWLVFLAKEMQRNNQTIFYIEYLQPDWLPDRQRSIYRLSIVLIFSLIGILVGGLIGVLGGELGNVMIDALVGGLGGAVVGTLGGVIGGLLIGGLVATLVANLIGGPIGMLIGGSSRLFGATIGPGALLSGLLFSVLLSGLAPFLEYLVLRFWLWRTSCLPWNIVAFLDEATERLLLRKVGKGYIFVHLLLLNYFASLDAVTPPQYASASADKSFH